MAISELYLEARQHCDKCQCDGCPFEAIDKCEDVLKIFELLVTRGGE